MLLYLINWRNAQNHCPMVDQSSKSNSQRLVELSAIPDSSQVELACRGGKGVEVEASCRISNKNVASFHNKNCNKIKYDIVIEVIAKIARKQISEIPRIVENNFQNNNNYNSVFLSGPCCTGICPYKTVPVREWSSVECSKIGG